MEKATDCHEIIPISVEESMQTDEKKKYELSVETNVVGDFQIFKDVFNSSARSSQDNKCPTCNKKGSRGTKGSRGGEENGEQHISFNKRASFSGNQIFKKLSPFASPEAVFENHSPDPEPRASML